MGNYRFDKQAIKKKIKRAKQLLKTPLTLEEKEKVGKTLAIYLGLLDTTLSVKARNLLDQLTKGKLTKNNFLKTDLFNTIIEQLHLSNSDYMDEEYLDFLLQLMKNISPLYMEKPKYSFMHVSDEQMIQIATSFFSDLGDKEINYYFQQIISKPNLIALVSDARLGNERFLGHCSYDYINNEPYIIAIKENNINDLAIVAHEAFHGIDFLMCPKLSSKTYYGFHEVSPYVCDYLMIDYLERQGIDSNEITKMKEEKQAYFCGLTIQVHYTIRSKLRAIGFDVKTDYSAYDVMQILDLELKNKLLEIQSGIMAYGFYKQILSDKQKGLENLKRFMKSYIPKNKVPDFSQYDLSNETLLNLSQECGLHNYLKQEAGLSLEK